MKRMLVVAFLILLIAGYWVSTTYFKAAPGAQPALVKTAGAGYFTCPMHPQIHSEHQGECPICHMKLIQIKNEAALKAKPENASSERSSIRIANDQFQLLGVQKEAVETMDLVTRLAFSGRLLSSSSLTFQVYESDLRYVRPGMGFKAVSSSYAEEEISGVISTVDTIVDPTSRTVRVVGAIKSGPRGLNADASVRGEIEVTLKKRLAIPESSVLHTGRGDLVYLIDENNSLKAQSVRLGIKTESFYEVLAGLKAGDVISSGPNFLIDSEAKIRGTAAPVDQEGKPATPQCSNDQHWDTPMAMCMPGKASK